MTATKTTAFQLLQWKYAIRLEMKGIKVARRSVNAHAGRFFGLGSHCKRETVLEHIEAALQQFKQADVPMLEARTVTVDVLSPDRDRYLIALIKAAQDLFTEVGESCLEDKLECESLLEAHERLRVALKPYSEVEVK